MEAETGIGTAVEASWRQILRRRLTVDLGGFWAIADQGVVSLGNFLTTIILARAVSPTAYGVWSVTFRVILFLNVLPASLITYPLYVRLAARDDTGVDELIRAALALTALLALPQALILVASSSLFGSFALGLWAGCALLLWQLQETTRRALMARLAFRTAVFTDAISYLGQASLCWVIARHGKLSVEIGFGVIALSCGVAAIAQLLLLRTRLKGPINLRDSAVTLWRTGRWILGSNLVTNFGIQAAPWALFLFRGSSAAAGFEAIANLLGVSHPIMLSMGNIMVPGVARARVRDGMFGARRVALGYAVQGGLLLLPYILALVIFPRQLLALFYGSGSSYVTLAGPLRLLALVYVLTYCSGTIKLFLNALELKNRALFLIESCACVLLGVLLVPLVLRFGLSGAVVATGLSLGLRLVSNLILLRRVNRLNNLWRSPAVCK